MALPVCRICLKPDSIMLPLFQRCTPDGTLLYSDMLNICANLKVRLGDSLPNKICFECLRNLELSYKFRSLAEKSNNILLNLPDTEGKNKVIFHDVEDLKLKLDTKVLLEHPPSVDSLSILDSVGEIAICNTSIRKINLADNIMEDDFIIEDYVGSDGDSDYEPSNDFSRKKIKKEESPSPFQTFAGKKKLITFENYEKKFSRKSAVPIKNRKIFILPNDGKICHIKNFDNYENLLKYGGGVAKKPGITKKTGKSQKPNQKLSGGFPIEVKGVDDGWVCALETTSEISEHKTRTKEKMVCPVCGILTYTLPKHMIIHGDKKPFECEPCKKSFNIKTYYDMHMKRHNGTKDQICEICGAAFYFNKSVVRHMLIHKAERPFLCNLCPKKFIAKCDLTRHKKVHAGLKPFLCDICSMAFGARHHLRTHMLIHTGEKPYACDVCNLSFTYKVNLNNHAIKVHGINIRYKQIATLTAEVLSEQYALAGQVAKSLPVLEFNEEQ